MPPTISVNVAGQTGARPKTPKSDNPKPKGPKQTPKGTKPKKGKRGPRGGGKPKSDSASVHAVCSVTNPFCDAAIGARYQDAAAHKSLPFQVRYQYFVAVGLTGTGVTFFDARPDGIYYANASTGSTTQIVPAVWTLATNSGLPTFDTSRLTSWGVRATQMQPVNTAAGIIKVYSLPEAPDLLSNFNTELYVGDDISVSNASPGTTMTWIAKPSNKVAARTFKSVPTAPAGDLTELMGTGWQCCAVVHTYAGTYGAATSTILIEVIGHYEFTLPTTSTLYNYTRPTPSPSAKVTDAADKVQAKIPNAIWNKEPDAIDKYVLKAAEYALQWGEKYAGDFLLALF